MLKNSTKSNITISQALERIAKSGDKYLIVVNNQNQLIGTLVDGDLRRAIISKKNLDDTIEEIYNKNPFYLVEENFDFKNVKKILLKKKINFAPVVDKNKKVLNSISLIDLLSDKEILNKHIDVPVVIMAGGIGSRLEPFTKILPKPLIPINNKPVIEHIIDSFLKFGIKNFFLSINYKSKILKYYFKEYKPKFKLFFLEEKKPLGTAGSLIYLKNTIDQVFFLTNSDIILHIDYKDLYIFHKKNKYDITLVTAAKEFQVSYGVCILNKNGSFKNIKEKPKFNFFTNTGVYVLNKSIINLITENKKIDMDELIRLAKLKKKKIGIFPISDHQWVDIGQWNEYQKAVNQLKNF
jgi:dTDP-glucose pyrophosphorylase